MSMNMTFIRRKNKHLKRFNITRSTNYCLTVQNPAFKDLSFFPDDWCGYNGICPLIEKDINEEARNLIEDVKGSKNFIGMIFNRNLTVDVCLYLCKHFRKFNIPKIIVEKDRKNVSEKK